MIHNPYLEELKKIPLTHDGMSRGSYARNSLELQWRIPAYRREPFKDYRHPMVTEYAWAIPSDHALKTIVKFSNSICEIGAGTGYWAYMLTQYGASVVAYDLAIPGRHKNEWGHKRTWFDVQHGDVLSINQHQNKGLMLCWPPYDHPMSEAILKLYTGSKVIYIGEGSGGCTGSEAFHELLETDFTEIDCIDIPQWDGIHDRVYLLERN